MGDIETKTKKRNKLQAKNSKFDGVIEATSNKIEELTGAIQANSDELKSITEIHNKKVEKFAATENELMEAIDTLDQAITKNRYITQSQDKASHTWFEKRIPSDEQCLISMDKWSEDSMKIDNFKANIQVKEGYSRICNLTTIFNYYISLYRILFISSAWVSTPIIRRFAMSCTLFGLSWHSSSST